MSDNTTDQLTENTVPLKDGATSFGNFFPKNYVLALFSSDMEAGLAANALRTAGFATDNVIVASGSDVADHDATVHAEQGILSRLGEQWSKLYTDEATDAGTLMTLARQGAAFVLAYAPEEEETTRATNVLRALHPTVLRKYDALKVTDLVWSAAESGNHRRVY